MRRRIHHERARPTARLHEPVAAPDLPRHPGHHRAAPIFGYGGGVVRVYEGDSAAHLGVSASVPDIHAIAFDHQQPGTRLFGLYRLNDVWTVGAMMLAQGLPSGAWQPAFTVQDIAEPLPHTDRMDDAALAASLFPGLWGQAWFVP